MARRPAKTEAFAIQISLMAVMAGLIAGATLLVRIPNSIGGYFNLGDVAIFAVALTFNPVVGGLAAGIGSSVADLVGFPAFALTTLIVKGLEGTIVGLISSRKSVSRDVLAVVLGGTEMILGYFFAEYYPMQMGLAGALVDLPTNITQIVVGGIVGVPIAYIVRRRLPEILK
jgi:uncharacterized membrane protein